MWKLERQKLSLPTGHDKLLLHSCCAPCSGEVMETLIESGIDFSIFFYNPNIHPVKEYLNSAKKKIFALQKNIIFHLLTVITTQTTGLHVPKAWKMSQRKVSVVPCVLICGLNGRHYMQQNMALA